MATKAQKRADTKRKRLNQARNYSAKRTGGDTSFSFGANTGGRRRSSGSNSGGGSVRV